MAPSAAGLANVNAPSGVRPPTVPPEFLNDILAGTTGGADVPVVATASADTTKLIRPLGTARPAAYGATYGYGMTTWYPAMTGAHGLIPDRLPPSDMVGGQETWRAWNPRTLRHEPVAPWDVGVTQ